jgi:tryptophan synthase alpha chain
MGYANPFYHYGVEKFFEKAQKCGVKGAIIPDLPFEESIKYKDVADKYNQALISFVAPTHDEQRIKKVVENSKEFVYLVAYAGITGSGQSEDLTTIIKNVKKYTNTPLYIGFGVDENTAKEKAKDVDGVIVGSAFVKHLIDGSLSNSEKISRISAIAKDIKEKINE